MLKINRKYFPSRKFLMALSIAVAVILLAIIFNYWKPNTTEFINSDLAFSTNASSSIMNIDSDNDGLPDWKENLYGTDPKKADTDGDGTNDAEEISQDRDPLKANTASKGQEPNDKIDSAIIEKNKKEIEDYEKLNEIDKFSRNLISNIVASQPTNGPMSTDTINSIVAGSLNELPQKNYTSITKDADLNLLKTDGTNLKRNMTDYVNNYYRETNKLVPILGTDLGIINSYISNGSTSSKSEMLKLTDKYQAIVNNLIKMPVPVAIGYYDINYHLRVINDLEKIIAIDKDIINSNYESLGIFSNIYTYTNIVQDLFSTLKTIDIVLKIQR